VLESLRADKQCGLVTARVRLNGDELGGWPWKIDEYENVMRWINSASGVKFIIDYRTAVGI
jgi:hypothetical protein